MTAQEIAKYRAQSTGVQATTMHEVMKLMPDCGNDEFGIACLMATAYNAGRAEGNGLPDDGGALGFYAQELMHTAKQISDAGALKRIYLLARRLLGKQAEQPTEQPQTARAWDMGNLLRYVTGLNDADVRRVTVVARTLAQMEQEAGREAPEPVSWAEKALALLPKLSAEDQEGIYRLIDRTLVCGSTLPQPESESARVERKAHVNALKSEANEGVKSEASEDLMFTLKALVNHEMADVAKPKTLDAILSYVRVVKQREGRE